MTFRENVFPLSIIVAVDEHGGFAKDKKIPWKVPEDLKHFKEVTMGGVCIMGRNTYEDTARMLKHTSNEPLLPGRESYVITRMSGANFPFPGATAAPNIRSVVQSLAHDDKREIFVIGGERMFIEALAWANKVYLTIIHGDYTCDQFFPVSALNKFRLVEGTLTANAKYATYIR
jgi:dihydrofolate reductase